MDEKFTCYLTHLFGDLLGAVAMYYLSLKWSENAVQGT